MMRKLLAFAAIAAFVSIHAQDRSCGSDEHMQEVFADPVKLAEHLERQARFEDYSRSLQEKAACANPVTLPIAIHFQGLNNPNRACLEALAQNQVDIVNADFQGLNVDISNWDNVASSFFPGTSNGDACIAFCLATQNHPSGYGLSDGQPAVTINQTSGSFESDWSGYLNVYVRNYFALGSSPLGGNGNGDGVIIDNNAFGSGNGCSGVSPNAPFDLGRTLTHELGHYFNLEHIWGGGCGSDDSVSDTPNSSGPYSGCPNNGASSCNSTDMHMNYMDYVHDPCMYMFSNGQATRMENYVAANLQNLVNNVANVCGGATGGGGCNASAFVDAPTGLSASFTASELILSWDAYADSRRCQIQGNRTSASGDGSFLVGDWDGGIEPTSRTFSLGQVDSDTEYRWRIRCACQDGGNTIASPFSEYAFFFTPPGIQERPNGENMLFKTAVVEEQAMRIFPNPTQGDLSIELSSAEEGIGHMRIVDIAGRTVINSSLALVKGHQVLRLDFSTLDAGTYFLILDGEGLQAREQFVIR